MGKTQNVETSLSYQYCHDRQFDVQLHELCLGICLIDFEKEFVYRRIHFDSIFYTEPLNQTDEFNVNILCIFIYYSPSLQRLSQYFIVSHTIKYYLFSKLIYDGIIT